jgi:hypothetical protein
MPQPPNCADLPLHPGRRYPADWEEARVLREALEPKVLNRNTWLKISNLGIWAKTNSRIKEFNPLSSNSFLIPQFFNSSILQVT